MKILIDMNLSPAWSEALRSAGFDAEHWSTIGDPRAKDHDLLKWALANGRILFTHDLGISAILSASGAVGPSVIQVRTKQVMPDDLAPLLIAMLHRHSGELESGAILTVEPHRARVRVLPLKRQS